MIEYRITIIGEDNQELFEYYSNKKESINRAKQLTQYYTDVTVEKITSDKETGMEEVECIVAY